MDKNKTQTAVEWLEQALTKIDQRSLGAVLQVFEQAKQMEKTQSLYWKYRCECAERFIELSPCDPDIYTDQIEAYNEWQHIVKTNKL